MKFACPVTEGKGKVDGNGHEYFHICINCRLTDREICNGDIIVCENNHKKQKYCIYTMRGAKVIEILERGEDEVLSFEEFKKKVEVLKYDR